MKAEQYVSIKLALPAYGDVVLATDGAEQLVCYRAHTDSDGEHWNVHEPYVTSDEAIEFEDVTHWQLLPGLPEKENG